MYGGSQLSQFDELPEGWKLAELGDLGSLINGDRGKNYPNKNDYVELGIPFINAGHIQDGKIDFNIMNFISEERFNLLGSGKVKHDDILYCLRGSLGKTALVREIEKGAIASSLVIIRPYNYLLPDYIYYFLVSPKGLSEISKYDNGSAQPNLSAKSVREYEVPLPPLNEQRRIVAKIEALGAHSRRAREALDAVPGLIEQFRQSVLAAAFRGDLTADWRTQNPDIEPASALLERIKLEDKEIPEFLNLHELPQGWKWVSLGSIGNVSGGLTKNSKRGDLPLEFPYLRVANVYANRLNLEEIKTIRVEQKEVQRVLLKEGDLLIVEGNGSIDQIGRVALWDGSIDPCLHQNHLIKARFQSPWLSNFVLNWLLSYQGRKYITNVASSSSGLHTLSLSKVASLPVPVAPKLEQEVIIKKINYFLKFIGGIEAILSNSATNLQTLEQSILAKAFRGELVPQDPNDEPASVLLERIRAEREQLAAATKPGKRRRKS